MSENLDVEQVPQQEGPGLRLELRQLGSGVSIRGVCLCVCVYVLSSVGVRMYESQQCFDQVQLLSMFAGKDGGFLVVFHEFIHGIEPALANTVHSI